MNPLAMQLNEVLTQNSPKVLEVLSEYGKRLFFPRGILAQTQEANQSAHQFNATIGIAREHSSPMHLDVSQNLFTGNFSPEEIYPYAPSPGLPDLRQAWAKHQKKQKGAQNCENLSRHQQQRQG